MKRKRDIQGKFTLKNQDYRQVRSLRLTDRTWKEWGIASECLGITRADLLENLVQHNRSILGDLGKIEPLNLEKFSLKTEKSLNRAVCSGTGGMGCGCNDIGSNCPQITIFRISIQTMYYLENNFTSLDHVILENLSAVLQSL